MISRPFLRLSGAALCAAGAAYILDTALDAALPPGDSPGLGALTPILGLIGFPGFWLRFRGEGREGLALAAYAATMLGLAGLVLVTFLNNGLFHNLTPEEIRPLIPGLIPAFTATGVVFLISAWLVLALSWRAGGSVRIGAILYALGAIPVSLPPLMPEILLALGGAAVGAGLLIWGLRLLAPPAAD
ncbi:MAG: hypothetical protein ACK5MQ_09800 [Pikeienuella sp.]